MDITKMLELLPIVHIKEPIKSKIKVKNLKSHKVFKTFTEKDKEAIQKYLDRGMGETLLTVVTGYKNVIVNHRLHLKRCKNKTGQLRYCQSQFKPNSNNWWYFQNIINGYVKAAERQFRQFEHLGDVYLDNKSSECIGVPLP
jgi:hypothetical protein